LVAGNDYASAAFSNTGGHEMGAADSVAQIDNALRGPAAAWPLPAGFPPFGDMHVPAAFSPIENKAVKQ
jgi:hypothetical protein